MIDKIIRAMQDTGLIDGMSVEDCDTLATAALEAMRDPSNNELAAANKTTSAVITRSHAREIYLSIIDAALNE